MNIRLPRGLVLVSALLGASAAAQTPINVALNKPVTLEGGSFFTGGWGGGWIADPATVTDGRFLPRGTRWDQGAVWWDARSSSGQAITIELGTSYRVESLVVQADDNDGYVVSYWDLSTRTWRDLWMVPGVGGWGMQTRPNPSDASQVYRLSAPVETTRIQVRGNAAVGDRLFSVSEVQVFAAPTQVRFTFNPASPVEGDKVTVGVVTPAQPTAADLRMEGPKAPRISFLYQGRQGDGTWLTNFRAQGLAAGTYGVSFLDDGAVQGRTTLTVAERTPKGKADLSITSLLSSTERAYAQADPELDAAYKGYPYTLGGGNWKTKRVLSLPQLLNGETLEVAYSAAVPAGTTASYWLLLHDAGPMTAGGENDRLRDVVGNVVMQRPLSASSGTVRLDLFEFGPDAEAGRRYVLDLAALDATGNPLGHAYVPLLMGKSTHDLYLKQPAGGEAPYRNTGVVNYLEKETLPDIHLDPLWVRGNIRSVEQGYQFHRFALWAFNPAANAVFSQQEYGGSFWSRLKKTLAGQSIGEISPHALGLAIDVNPSLYPWYTPPIASGPNWEVWNQVSPSGLQWLNEYGDPMHFEIPYYFADAATIPQADKGAVRVVSADRDAVRLLWPAVAGAKGYVVRLSTSYTLAAGGQDLRYKYVEVIPGAPAQGQVFGTVRYWDGRSVALERAGQLVGTPAPDGRMRMFLDLEPVPSGTYPYSVRAYDENGVNDHFNLREGAAGGPQAYDLTPTVIGEGQDTFSLELGWSLLRPDQASNFEILYRTQDEGAFSTTGPIPSTQQSYQLHGLLKAKAYRFVVRTWFPGSGGNTFINSEQLNYQHP